MKTVSAVLIAAAILILIYLSARGVVAILGDVFFVLPWWATALVWHGTMLLTALVVVAVISKGEFSRFGFRSCDKLYIWKSAAYSLPLFLISKFAGLIFFGLTEALFGGAFAYDLGIPGLPASIIDVGLLGSILEEVAFRGLIQTYLSSRIPSSFRFLPLRFSHANLITAILFSLTHLHNLTRGIGAAQMVALEVSVLVLGLAAGHFREKSGSLIPAIIIHVLFNVLATGWESFVTKGV